MKFNEFVYNRPDLKKYEEEIKELLEVIGSDVDCETELKTIYEIMNLNDILGTQFTLASIRNSINMKDDFYDKEINFINENSPYLRQYSQQLVNKMLNSKNRECLEKNLGKLLFDSSELSLKTFDVKIIEDLQKENKLRTDYSKLIASAKIEFNNEEYNLSQMAPFVQDKDRTVRKSAQLAVSKFFSDNESEFDRLYDELVQVRHEIALKLGYENFIQLGYDRMGRLDYNSKDVKNYRDQVYEEVVPYVVELTKRKGVRLNIDKMMSYDLALSFLSGNPTPKGDREWQVSRARKMYKEMSKETHEFFEFMLKHELMDLDAKAGKNAGGYCAFLADYKAPFIFANFNGTAHDVDVLTHEAGHAFQVYQSKDLIPAYRWPTMEAAEIHSMSMEFLAWPWIDKFFKEDTDKYKFNHLSGAISFLPYGVLVDEFQHEIYSNPKLTPDERKQIWRKLELKYLPFKDYQDDEFLNKGGFWFRQGHIFSSPFYYIDYTLAQVVAFQYWTMSRKDHDKAFESYLSLCKLGGSKTFLQLLEYANLDNPFEKGSIKKIIKPLKEYLNSIDDTKL